MLCVSTTKLRRAEWQLNFVRTIAMRAWQEADRLSNGTFKYAALQQVIAERIPSRQQQPVYMHLYILIGWGW